MKIKTEAKTIEEYCRFFDSRVTYYKAFTNYAIYFKHRGEFYGSIDGNDLWIVRTKQLNGGLPQRFFQGRIFENSENVYIEGKFRFSTLTYVWTAVTILLFFMSSFPTDVLIRNPISTGIPSMAAIIGFPLSILGLGLLTSKNAEKDVVQLLQGTKEEPAAPYSDGM